MVSADATEGALICECARDIDRRTREDLHRGARVNENIGRKVDRSTGNSERTGILDSDRSN